MNGQYKIDICLSPALYPCYAGRQAACVVVVDVFRATTCMCAGLHAGVAGIVPVASIDEAEHMKAAGHIVAAERNVAKCDFADLGNSPFDYMQPGLQGQEVVMTTTNGTQAIALAREAGRLAAGAFVNLSRVAAFCEECAMDVLVLCAGWNNRVNVEDTLFAGALAERLLQSGRFEAPSDAARIALTLWRTAQPDAKAFLQGTEHLQRLLAHGLERDVDYCLTLDVAPALPVYDRLSGTMKPLP